MKNLLIIANVWPEPSSSAAGSRMLQLIDFFQKEQWNITFACSANESDFMFPLQSIGIKTQIIQLNDISFDEFLKDENPQIVLFDRFMTEEQFGWRVDKHTSNALKIVDTEDLHFLRSARQEAFKKNGNLENINLHNDLAKREIASIYRCDLTLIISNFEYDLLIDHFKIDKNLLFYLPFIVSKLTEEVTSKWNSFENRKHFVFIGSFKHEPNWNTVLYLKQTIWPLIRKELPKAEIHIYGSYPTQKVTQLHSQREGFYIKGRAESAKEVMEKARVLVAPIRFGAGLKGKFIDSMNFGCPNITTSIGAEGMTLNENWSGRIENDPINIANAAIELHQNKEQWIKSQEFGIQIINSLFQKEAFESEFKRTIQELILNIKTHRNQNFIGSMLQHHTNKSTQYMSLWIEEKNKNN